MTSFDKATFIEKAKQICLESFVAYFVENDMSKSCAHMPKDRFKSFCIDTLHQQVDYKDFMDYIIPTTEYEHSAFVENVELQAPFATDELCVIFLTAKVFFVIDNGYKIQYDVRISYVVTQKEGQLAILHLHYSMPHKNIRKIHFRDQEEDRNLYINPSSEQATKDAATAAGMYSPNGLIFYQISGKEQINLTNAALFKLLGYAGNKDLLTSTNGNLEKLVLPQDWPRVREQLAKRDPGKVFNMNVTFLCKDGTPIKVLLRGRYVENHNSFYILSLTPLLLPEEQFVPDDYSMETQCSQDYSISYELYLKIALDIFVEYGREKGIPHLLELATTVLNAHNGWICDVRELDAPIKLVRNYTVPGYKKLTPYNMPSRCCLYFCHKFVTSTYNSHLEMPQPMHGICQGLGINGWTHEIISINGKESFLLYFLRQEASKPWTENEKKIMRYTSKMFAMLLDTYAQKHPVQSILNGGAQ